MLRSRASLSRHEIVERETLNFAAISVCEHWLISYKRAISARNSLGSVMERGLFHAKWGMKRSSFRQKSGQQRNPPSLYPKTPMKISGIITSKRIREGTRGRKNQGNCGAMREGEVCNKNCVFANPRQGVKQSQVKIASLLLGVALIRFARLGCATTLFRVPNFLR